jgi:hypothetical protein
VEYLAADAFAEKHKERGEAAIGDRQQRQRMKIGGAG